MSAEQVDEITVAVNDVFRRCAPGARQWVRKRRPLLQRSALR